MRGWKGPDAMKQPTGKVYLVGAGPGAPDLITLRGADILGRADIVFHDALVHPDVLALAARAEKIAVGKRCGKFTTAQQFINKRLVDAARKYQVVVRLKGGDGGLLNAIAFRSVGQKLGNALLESRGRAVHVAGCLSVDRWQGEERVQLRILDLAAADRIPP